MPARPVSLFTIAFLFVLFAAFPLIAWHVYAPAAVAPENAAAENLPKELEWRATRAARVETLRQLQRQQAAEAASWGWIDQPAGVVRLPIERAMELTVEKYGRKQ